MALSFSVLSASVLWLFGQSGILVVEFNASTTGITLYVDEEGWMWTFGPAVAGKPLFDVRTQPNEGSASWVELLSDLSPNWYTQGLVVTRWQPNPTVGTMVYLCGLKHYVLVPVLGFATLFSSLWYRRRWPTSEDSE